MATAEYRVHILESNGKISNTILFSGLEQENHSKYLFLPDDSIRTIKMKILYELHNALHIRSAYEEIYLYGYTSEETSTLHLLNELKSATGEEDDPKIPISTVAQMLEGHPDAEKIIKKLKNNNVHLVGKIIKIVWIFLKIRRFLSKETIFIKNKVLDHPIQPKDFQSKKI